jgi:hypothetical protein
MRYTHFLAVVALFASVASASEEEFLAWSEVTITAVQHEQTGRVTFTAEVRDDAWRKVEADAFGKKYTLSKEQCAKLSGFPLSSIRTTHEAGYKGIGGHTVYFKFSKSIIRDGKPVESKIIVSISREKGIDVLQPAEHAE